jgi:hypothetical protein
VAVGTQMNKVAAEASRKTGSGLMFVALVGNEDVELRIRQVVSGHSGHCLERRGTTLRKQHLR